MSEADRVVRLDTRGLHPPEPMIRILRAIDAAPSTSWGPPVAVEALLDRRPLFLFPELEARGLAFVCEPRDGGYALTVRMTP